MKRANETRSVRTNFFELFILFWKNADVDELGGKIGATCPVAGELLFPRMWQIRLTKFWSGKDGYGLKPRLSAGSKYCMAPNPDLRRIRVLGLLIGQSGRQPWFDQWLLCRKRGRVGLVYLRNDGIVSPSWDDANRMLNRFCRVPSLLALITHQIDSRL